MAGDDQVAQIEAEVPHRGAVEDRLLQRHPQHVVDLADEKLPTPTLDVRCSIANVGFHGILRRAVIYFPLPDYGWVPWWCNAIDTEAPRHRNTTTKSRRARVGLAVTRLQHRCRAIA